MDGSLNAVAVTWQHARRVRRVMQQNIVWALGYNTLAIPLAAFGYIPPWAAALGMSLSSLLVVGNSLRLQR
jgi:Cu2+-exporting ATPase